MAQRREIRAAHAAATCSSAWPISRTSGRPGALETEAYVYCSIFTVDDAQARVLEGVALRQGFEVALPAPLPGGGWDLGDTRERRPDALILDAVQVTADVESRLGEFHRLLPGSHIFLLLETEAPLASDTAGDMGDPSEAPTPPKPAIPDDLELGPSLGVCMIQRKPFHPVMFFRAAVRTMAQEDCGKRPCPALERAEALETAKGEDERRDQHP